MKAFKAELLPIAQNDTETLLYFNELIDATAKFEVYKMKIQDSKLDSAMFMPLLQQKESLASSVLEGTQATIDGVLINQITPNDKDKNLAEVMQYYDASKFGHEYLKKAPFSINLIEEIHARLLKMSSRRNNDEIGKFRTRQNYIGNSKGNNELVFIPPIAEDVPLLMNNLVQYINESDDKLKPLVRAAIIHAQFLTIHPFMDGNGRVGRILIPLYLYSQGEIELPYFFISEALERDKFRYYKLLTNIRTQNAWGAWIKFFLETVAEQCSKYINMIDEINRSYNDIVKKVCQLTSSSKMLDVINVVYRYAVVTSSIVQEQTGIPPATVNRYLNILVEEDILDTDNKQRNRTFFCYPLLRILRT